MTSKRLFLSFVLIFILSFVFAQQVTLENAFSVSNSHIFRQEKSNQYTVHSATEISDNNVVIAYKIDLRPRGYVVVSAERTNSPIFAYSFENDFGIINRDNTMLNLIKNGLKIQKISIKAMSSEYLNKNNQLWEMYLSPDKIKNNDLLDQWPSTGNGWLQTNWTQTAPYSNFCPIDPITSQRSYTGCPATAMAQILNFHRTINGTHFNDNDDYFHNYAGRQFNIDDDSGDFGFPSFPELNSYLDTVQSHWDCEMPLTNNDKAALNFACGVAASQVFTSEGSGTFSVSQTYDAYHRFGCETAELIQADDLSLINQLIQNMKDTLPAHLAIVDSTWSTGHNVVVDGYNSDGFFHVNFGWGGSSNGWYLIPQEMPYEMTYFEGVVLNIMKKSSVYISENKNTEFNMDVFPNPFIDKLNVKLNCKHSGSSTLSIFDDKGMLLYYQLLKDDVDNLYTFEVPDHCPAGIFFYLFTNDSLVKSGKIIKVE